MTGAVAWLRARIPTREQLEANRWIRPFAHRVLRSDGRLRALHLCEYGAQAMAVHGGVLARERGERAPPGMLVALRGVQLHVSRIDDLDARLHCEASVLVQSAASQQYAFAIRCGEVLLAEGRAAVMLGTLPPS